jgi:hypothetical protein
MEGRLKRLQKKKQKEKEKEGFQFKFDIRDSNEDNTTSAYDFEGCCGAKIVSYLPQNTLSGLISKVKDVWLDQVDDFLGFGACDKNGNWVDPKHPKIPSNESFRSLILQNLHKLLPVPEPGTVYILILNEVQNWMGSILKKYGYRLVSNRTINRRTDNRLYVYLLDPVSPRGKTNKKRMFL